MIERDEFEAWLKSTIGAQADLRFMLRDYSNGFTNDLWQAWQTARATPQQAVPVLTWVGLTDKERDGFVDEIVMHGTGFVTPLYAIIEEIEGLLRAKNAAAPQPSQEETK